MDGYLERPSPCEFVPLISTFLSELVVLTNGFYLFIYIPDKADEIFKPTNVLAQKAVLDSDKFKVSNGVTRLRVMPFTAFKPVSKVSYITTLNKTLKNCLSLFITIYPC